MAKDDENAADAEYKLMFHTRSLCGHSAAKESREARLTGINCSHAVVFGPNMEVEQNPAGSERPVTDRRSTLANGFNELRCLFRSSTKLGFAFPHSSQAALHLHSDAEPGTWRPVHEGSDSPLPGALRGSGRRSFMDPALLRKEAYCDTHADQSL